nr:protein nrt1/ ptr family 2.8 [Quercus suber]
MYIRLMRSICGLVSPMFLPSLGAFVANTYQGRFHTIVFGTGASLLGMGIMALIVGMTMLKPSLCIDKSNCPQPQSWQLAILSGDLALVAIGFGGVQPCNIAFGADQLDTRTEEGRAQLESFCNCWYFLFTVAVLVALTGVVYVQTSISWLPGFVIPTCYLALPLTIFLLGRNTYMKNHSTKGQPSPQSFHDPLIIESEDSETHRKKLGHTDRFKFLDKAAAITDPSELDNQGKPKNGWTLRSLQQVEELKCTIGVLPMKRSVGPHFQIPPAWMGLIHMIDLSTWIRIYERVYVPLTQKRAKKDKRMTMEQRIMIGIVMAILCMLVAGFIEMKRRDSALKHGSFESPITVALLVPQFYSQMRLFVKNIFNSDNISALIYRFYENIQS